MGEVSLRRRLDSWKEIAAYIKRDERTAQRWAKERGLPVHHVPGSGRGSVFAYTDSIDAWLNGEAAKPRSAAPASESAARRRVTLSWHWLAGLGAALAVAGVVVAVRSSGWLKPGEIERIGFRGNEVVALDPYGQQVWIYRTERSLSMDTPDHPGYLGRLARVFDLDGDGRNEALVVVRMRAGPNISDPHHTALLCFSPEGKVLWKYQATEAFTFSGQEYRGPWGIYDVLVVPASPQPLIWVAVVHYISFPSFVVEVDPASGKGLVRFMNSGALYALAYTKSEEGRFLLVGGFNSEYDAGNLAVVDLEQPFAASPQTFGSRYYCQSCPEGSPTSYFVFPRSELNRLKKVSLNNVHDIMVREDGVKASTVESSLFDRAFYEFAPSLDPRQLRVFFTTDYWKEHEALEKEGKIRHPARQCPDRVPSRVRVWSPNSGWTEVAQLSR